MPQFSWNDIPKVFKPYDHQEKVAVESLNKDAWAFYMEAGTGKTKVTIDQVLYHYLNGHIDLFIVMAKKGEYANWLMIEWPIHWPKDVPCEIVMFHSYTIQTVAGKNKMRSLMKPDKGRLRVLVINIESMQGAGERVLKEICPTSKAIYFALDEATCAKNHKSKRSIEVYKYSAKALIRRIMTGTSVTQSPLDLWGQAMVLKKGLLGFTSFTSFKGYYAEEEKQFYGDRSFNKIVGYRRINELRERLQSFSHVILKKDCLDLPDKVYVKKVVMLTPEQEKLYTQMRDEAMMDYGDIQVEVTNVLAQITKLHQVVCGQLKHEDGAYTSLPNNRLDVASEILEDFSGKAIIWATYRQTLADILARLRKDYGSESVVAYYGGVSQSDRDHAINSFQDRSSPVRFFVANPQSAGYGLTLTAATMVMYYSNGYNLEHRLQSEDRAHRIGQTESVTYIDLITPGTVDERIIDILRNKKSLASEVIGTSLTSWI